MSDNLQDPSRAGRSARVTTDGVVAAYIHEISERHGPAEPEAEEAVPPPAEQ